jgi:hypothetical protein
MNGYALGIALILIALICLISGCAAFQAAAADPNSSLSKGATIVGSAATVAAGISTVVPEPWSTIVLSLTTIAGVAVAMLKHYQLKQSNAINQQNNAINQAKD